MLFFTDPFSRPRPGEPHARAILMILGGMSRADRGDIAVRPADFPRIARDMVRR